jgi:LmbE family N-acetylglucosaminyl deacetylase
MLSFTPLVARKRPLELLCLGAHSDDLEIGCGGTVLDLLRRYPQVKITWVVLSAPGQRAVEARRSARALLRGAVDVQIVLDAYPDAYFPAQFESLKTRFEELKRHVAPDVILTHRLEDRHQDHRVVGELTWQTWRDHLILEYEIPKYEGDLGQPNVYVPLSAQSGRRKVRHLLRYFGTQRSKSWFNAATFAGLMSLRAVECRAESGFAEAFHLRKATIGVSAVI